MSVKGIVLALEAKSMIVLTDEGQFIKLPAPSAPVFPGQKIELPRRQGVSPALKILIAACLVLIFFTAAGGYNYVQDTKAVAYLSVDINPSLELGLNRKGLVVEVLSFNPEAAEIVQNLNLKGMAVGDAVAAVVRQADQNGYLQKPGEQAVVLAISGEETMVGSWLETARNQAQKEVSLRNEDTTVRIVGLEAPQAARIDAQKQGVSVGKYLLVLEALDKAGKIAQTDLAKQNISGILAKSGLTLEELETKAKEYRNQEKFTELQQRVYLKLQDQKHEGLRQGPVSVEQRNNKKPSLSSGPKDQANQKISPPLKDLPNETRVPPNQQVKEERQLKAPGIIKNRATGQEKGEPAAKDRFKLEWRRVQDELLAPKRQD